MIEAGRMAGTGIEVRVVADKEAVSRDFGRVMADLIKANNAAGRASRFIVPVGPTGQYAVLAAICREEKIDLSGVHLFAMDEYVGDDGRNLPGDHPFSFARFLRENFIEVMDPACGLRAEQVHVPDARDPEGYSAMIAADGGIEVCFGGIGINGHVAFNEALEYWEVMSNEAFAGLGTRVVKVAATTKVVNAIFGTGGNMQVVPNLAVTVGMKEILGSAKVRVYLDWFWQKQVLRNTLFGPVTGMFPASLLQEHGDVTITVTQCVAEEPGVAPE